MSKFTPGPWMYAIEEDERGAYCDIHDRNARLVAHCPKEDDARLIAAAPEMYDALMLLQSSEVITDTNAAIDSRNRARALLARIDGED